MPPLPIIARISYGPSFSPAVRDMDCQTILTEVNKKVLGYEQTGSWTTAFKLTGNALVADIPSGAQGKNALP
jgi:hypothetical protein